MKHLLILLALVLVAVGAYSYSQFTATTNTDINFIGIATGTLATDVNDLTFSPTFSVDDHEIVGVVSFDSIQEGSIVQATWFSPDDRRIPLGRKEIVTQSGAKVAKFSIANSATWEPSPYMLDIYVYNPTRTKTTASGSTHFFIGMEEEAIREYLTEYRTYKQLELEERNRREAEQRENETIKDMVSRNWNADDAGISLRLDITGDGKEELFITDPIIGPDAQYSDNTILSMDIDNMAIYDKSGSGSALFLLESGRREKLVHVDGITLDQPILTGDQIKLTIPSESTLRLEWNEGTDACAWNLRFATGSYTTTDRACARAS